MIFQNSDRQTMTLIMIEKRARDPNADGFTPVPYTGMSKHFYALFFLPLTKRIQDKTEKRYNNNVGFKKC